MPGATRGSSLPMAANRRSSVVRYDFLILSSTRVVTVSHGRDPERGIKCQAAKGSRRAAVSNITARRGDPAGLRNRPGDAKPDRLRRLQGDACEAGERG